jgi:hypothetical protein
LLDKSIAPFECKYQIVSTTTLVFVDSAENSVWADDVVTPSNLPITPIKEEEFEETSFDVNVSQPSHDEKPFKKVVHNRIDRFVWDRRSFLNPHVLTIY